MYVNNKSSSDQSVHQFRPSEDFSSWAVRNARRIKLERDLKRYDQTSPPDRTFFREDRTLFYKDAVRQIPPSDVINLHWVSGFLDYGAFFEWLPQNMRLVWTSHDMASFTGGCCYDMGCGKFAQQCGACPQLGSQDSSDLTSQVWHRKKKYFDALNLSLFHIVTPSRWLGEEVKRSPLLSRFPRSVIPYGLDLNVFQPREPRAAREVLGIPSNAKVVLFVSHELHTARKGFRFLNEALAQVDQVKDLFLLSLGSGFPPQMEQFPHVHIPSVTEDRLLSLIYSAADIFVAPSLADNLPNTILESIACGTPVVAFDAGGMPDMVRPNQTGLLAATGNSAELRAAIVELLNNAAKRREFSQNCRVVALTEYELSKQANRYIQLYQGMLNRAAR